MINMKKFLIFICFFAVITSDCFSQLKIIDSSKDQMWYIVRTTGFYPPFDFQYMTTVLKLRDFVINNESSYATVLETADSSFTDWKILGQISESNHQVFFNPISSDSLYLIYDFNLRPFSTFNLSEIQHSITYQILVENIDTVLMGGENRKRITFKGINEVWIEGIGSLQGLLHKGYGISGAKYELGCYTENGNIIFHNPTYPTCFYTTDIKTSNDYSKTLIVVKGKISVLQKMGARFQLFDISGVKILDRSIVSNFCSINTDMLQSGVYLFRLAALDSHIIGKLIIDNKD